MIDFYLRSPPTRRYLLDVENTESLTRSGTFIVIKTLKSDGNPTSEILASGERYNG